jgi:multidrug efflux system membrane fusion protein
MARSRWVTFLVLMCAAVGSAGCERVVPKLAPTKPPEVVVARPQERVYSDFEDFTGRTDAMFSIETRARVSGYLDKVSFKDGDEVKEGDLLFEIDPRPYQAELERTEATVVQNEAHMKRLKADNQRALNLFQRSAISREEFDRITGDYAEAEAAVGVAVANRGIARLNLEFTKIKAPISGRLSRRMVDPGNLVQADVTPLTSIVTLDPMYVYFDVDERTLLRLRRLVEEGKIRSRAKGAEVPVLIGLSDEDGFPHQGKINFSDNRVDVATGTLRVRGVVDNANRMLSPGLFVRVRLPVGDPHKDLTVPEEAVGTDQGRKFLYVVTKQQTKVDGETREVNVVDRRDVEVGPLVRAGSKEWRVIHAGLKPDERIIVSGLQRVRPKAKVTPIELDAPEPSKALAAADVPQPAPASPTAKSTAAKVDRRAE